MTKKQELEEIINNFINGNLRDMAKGIDEYGKYDFFTDLNNYLFMTCNDKNRYKDMFIEITLKYHKIAYR